ncbi:hypothetical protein [Cellulomonas sp. RIT-PI-Y]|uniref:hypothetical protein n=1 Tax=Cellulomonas sp. RIT-PI-Y TaxID=3035297 RepID=UPI0021DB7989|nr:hypothetical protein [Cellulomonas sp. RIT-PI-Y]
MTTLRFGDSAVRSIGTTLRTLSRAIDGTMQWNSTCDLGDEPLNDLLATIRQTSNNGVLGVQTAVFALGGAALDAADAWTEADRRQVG